MTEKKPKGFNLDDYKGVGANYSGLLSYAELYETLPREERANYADVLFSIGNYGVVPENARDTYGGKLALTQRVTLMNSRESSLCSYIGKGKIKRKQPSSAPSGTPTEYPHQAPPPATSRVDSSGVESAYSEEEEGFTSSRDMYPDSLKAERQSEGRAQDAPFGLCDDCGFPLRDLPPINGEVSYECSKCGRLYEKPNTAGGASVDDEIPF